MKKLLSVGLISLGLLSTAGAAEKISPYIGLEAGAAFIGSDYAVFEEETYLMLKGNLGLRYGKYVGAEISYEMSNEKEYKFEDGKNEGSYTAFGLDVLGYLPINESFDLIGSIGVARYSFEAKWHDYYFNESGKESEDKTTVRFGIGAQFNLNENIGFTVMAKYSPISIDDEDGDDIINGMFNLTVGAKFSF